MLHLFAALAEKERALISARTKAALEAEKDQGVKLGNPIIAEARVKAEEARVAGADEFARTVAPVIRDIQKRGVTSLRGIARAGGPADRDAARRDMDAGSGGRPDQEAGSGGGVSQPLNPKSVAAVLAASPHR